MLEYTKRMKELFYLLQDEQSKAVFWARLRNDVEQSLTSMANLSGLRDGITPEESQKLQSALDELAALQEKAKLLGGDAKLIIYGTATLGQRLAQELERNGIPFYGFCGRHAASFADGLMGRPVLLPEELFAKPEQYFVIVAARGKSYPQIMETLAAHHFPKDHILPGFAFGEIMWDPDRLDESNQDYFRLPFPFPKETAFVDAGCYDGETSRLFAQWCGGGYSKIFAFEPDPKSFLNCRANAEKWGLKNFELIPAGLFSETCDLEFFARQDYGSAITGMNPDVEHRMQYDKGTQTVHVAALDEAVGAAAVGFIKMDIEGAELDALHGAQGTIRRDRPLLAICVYHRPGDLLAIMDYLHALVPEYRFWLRHYSRDDLDTVLYASVKGPDEG